MVGKYKFQLPSRDDEEKEKWGPDRKRTGDQTAGIWEGQQHIVLPRNYLSCAESRNCTSRFWHFIAGGKNSQHKLYSCVMTLVFCIFSSRFSFFTKYDFWQNIMGKFLESSVCKLDGPHLSVVFLHRPRKEGIGTVNLLHVPSSFVRGQYLMCQTHFWSFLRVFWKVIQN